MKKSLCFIVKKTSRERGGFVYLNSFSLPLSYSNSIKYLGIEFSNNLNLSNFFNKFSSVSKSFYSLNYFGLKPGGINPFSQSFIYKSFRLSRLLYGLEIFSVNKKNNDSNEY